MSKGIFFGIRNDFPEGINAVIFLLHQPAGQGSRANMLSFDDERVAEFFADTSLELLTASVASYRAIGAWNTDPVMSEESFNRLQTVMTEAGELTKTADFDAVVNNTFAEKAKG